MLEWQKTWQNGITANLWPMTDGLARQQQILLIFLTRTVQT